VLSVTLAGCLTAFMFQYLHPLDEKVVSIGQTRPSGRTSPRSSTRSCTGWPSRGGVTGFVLSTALLFGPLLFLLRRCARRPAAPPSRWAPSAC
jgi:hypothetical protein